jgi:transposase
MATTVTLIPPAYVRPYVRRNKTDRADAEAIFEAVRTGQMPRVPVKRVEQQALVAMHRVREQWVTTRTSRINTLRGAGDDPDVSATDSGERARGGTGD